MQSHLKIRIQTSKRHADSLREASLIALFLSQTLIMARSQKHVECSARHSLHCQESCGVESMSVTRENVADKIGLNGYDIEY
jgi:hypothetical protein